MEVQPLHRFQQSLIDNLLGAIPFYKAVKQQDPWQYDLLMSQSRIIEYRPGEVVLEKGQHDQWLYFLLKGQLAVVVGEDHEDTHVVNYITPGEVFGDLAVLVDHKRTATVLADNNARRVMVFCTDFGVFGELLDTSKICLRTKLSYYRNMVHSLRWKLEVYRMNFPDQAFASDHRKVKLYCGPKETLEELKSLDKQARELARLLVSWNLEFDRLSLTPRECLDMKSLYALG